jgi:hypothetical protein
VAHEEEILVATCTNQAQRTHRLFQGFPEVFELNGTPHLCI